MTVIIYSSHTGSTKKYAELLSESTGIPCYSVKDHYDGSDKIIYMGWLRGPSIVGLDSVDRHKVIAIVAVSLDSNPDFGWQKVKDVNKIACTFYHLRGWIDRKKLNPIEKLFFYFLCAMYKLKGLNSHTEPLFNAMMEGGSFFDESDLENIKLFCSNHL